MKSLFIILFIGIAYANGQGTEFLVDNLLNPFINNITSGLQNYLFGQLLGSLFGSLGKRELPYGLVNQLTDMISKYVQKLKEIVRNFIQQIHNAARPIFDALLAETNQQIQFASSNLTGQLFSALQSI
jgi:hypothetical protein